MVDGESGHSGEEFERPQSLMVSVLGPVQVRRGPDLVGPAGVKRRGLFALLTLAANRPVVIDTLIRGLWADSSPPSAVNVVQNYVSVWRKAIEADHEGGASGRRLRTVDGGYELRLATDECDVSRFESLTGTAGRHASAGRFDAAAASFAQALELWTGPALTDVRSAPFAADAIAALERRRTAAVEGWARSCLDGAVGDPVDIVAALAQIGADDPLRECAVELHMWALCRAGQPARALQLFDRTRRLLADELGVDPSAALRAMHQRVLCDDTPLRPVGGRISSAHAARVRTRPDVFVGRGRELEDVSRLLETNRLVTLVGPGGSGKTRLAEQAALSVNDTVFVEFAGTKDSAMMPGLVAAACGLSTAHQVDAARGVVDHLRESEHLLILDNLEHLSGAPSFVDMLHRGTARLRILVTSRRPLNVAGEQTFVVAPLPVPRGNAALAVAEGSDAITLFAHRVRAVDPSFTVDDKNVDDLTAIVRRLDGLPLALEIAAPWLRILSTSELRRRLQANADLASRRQGTSVRHSSVNSAIAWSYELLGSSERRLLTRLSVFRGSASLSAVEASCADGLSVPVLDLLAELVDLNLVVAVRDTEPPRVRLLETVRAFAAERLRESDEQMDAFSRHRRYFAAWAAQLEAHREGSDAHEWLQAAAADIDNLRAALDACPPGSDSELDLVVDCMALWHDLELNAEGVQRLDDALRRCAPDARSRPVATAYLAWLMLHVDEHRAGTLARRAVDLARGSGDVPVEALAWQTLGAAAQDWPQQRSALDEAMRLVSVMDQSPSVTRRTGITAYAIATGIANEFGNRLHFRDVDAALAAFERLSELAAPLGDVRTGRWALVKAAEVLVTAGRLAQAHHVLRQADDDPAAGYAILRWQDVTRGRLAQCEGRHDDAVACFTRAFDAADEHGAVFDAVAAAGGLVDTLIDVGRIELAEEILRRGESSAARSHDRVKALMWVRRARVDRLLLGAPLIDGLLDRASRNYQPDQLLPDRIVWFVESIGQARMRHEHRQAQSLLDELIGLSAATGVVIPPWERRLVDHHGGQLTRTG